MAVFLRLTAIFSRGKFPVPDERLSRNGRELRWCVTRANKGNGVIGFTLATPVTSTLAFVLRKESAWDRVAKAFGLASEFQTGDHRFDERVFILSEDRVVHEVLALDARLRESVLGIVEHRGSWKIGAGNGWLHVYFGGSLGYDSKAKDEKIADDFANGVGALLASLAERVNASAALASASVADARDRRAATFGLVCGVLGALGVVGFFVSMITGKNHQVVFANTEHIAQWAAGGAAGVLLIWLFTALAGTSRTHSLLIDVVLAAVPGVWFASMAAASWFNQTYDTAPVTRELVFIEQSYVRTGSKGGRRYYVVVSRWPDERGDRKLRVSSSHQAAAKQGHCVFALWHPGALGDGWISGFEPAAAGACGAGVDQPRVERD